MHFEDRRSFVKRSLAAAIAAGLTGRGRAQEKQDKTPAAFVPRRMKGDFTLTAVGDLIVAYPILEEVRRTSPLLLELLKSDATFGNFEDTVVDLKEFKGYPEALSGGGWLLSEPGVPGDLKTMGFDLVSRANNHATDWGVAGMLETDRRLDEAGLIHGGTGRSLTAAREPAYFEGRKGRVALIAMSAHFTEMEPAQDGLGDIQPRPGINALHLERYIRVPEEQFQQLAAMRDMQPEPSKDKKANVATLFGTKYEKGKADQKEMSIHYTVNAKDKSDILLSIRQGREIADMAIASIHVHEPGNYSETPPDFLQGFAHDAIDAGADALIGHGPHQLRGIEIYKGKPIYYSLGDFAYMGNSRSHVTPAEYEATKIAPGDMTPAEVLQERLKDDFDSPIWFESVVAVNRYKDGALVEIHLHAIDLGYDGPTGKRGIPMIATPEKAEKILAKLQRLSQPFGTEIVVREHVGVIAVKPG